MSIEERVKQLEKESSVQQKITTVLLEALTKGDRGVKKHISKCVKKHFSPGQAYELFFSGSGELHEELLIYILESNLSLDKKVEVFMCLLKQNRSPYEVWNIFIEHTQLDVVIEIINKHIPEDLINWNAILSSIRVLNSFDRWLPSREQKERHHCLDGYINSIFTEDVIKKVTDHKINKINKKMLWQYLNFTSTQLMNLKIVDSVDWDGYLAGKRRKLSITLLDYILKQDIRFPIHRYVKMNPNQVGLVDCIQNNSQCKSINCWKSLTKILDFNEAFVVELQMKGKLN